VYLKNSLSLFQNNNCRLNLVQEALFDEFPIDAEPIQFRKVCTSPTTRIMRPSLQDSFDSMDDSASLFNGADDKSF